MVWKASALLVLAILGGCADQSPEPPAAQDEAPPGVLRGVVVDPAIEPVPNVTLRAEPGGHETVTDHRGEFQYEGLEPRTYTLTASRDGFLETTVVATLLDDRASPVVKIILPRDPEAVRFVSAFQFQGFFECGGGVDDITCSNVNIITWIILGIGNVTNDRSLWLQWIDGRPSALQTELVWESTQPLGDSLGFAVGGATQEQLSTGMATTHNYTFGPSPLALTIPQPELGDSGIGADRALLTQVVPAPYQEVPGGCVVYNPCGLGVQLMQPFETFTHAFYGFEPEPEWRFTEHGAPTPP